MRLLMLPRYEPLGASSRLRTYQYVPKLREAGIDVTVSPLFSDAYVRALYARSSRSGEVIRGYLRRVMSQVDAANFDVVWLEKELLPWLPRVFERISGRPALVVDYDDAVFHNYDEHRSVLVRHVLGRKIDNVMARADVVTAGNAYIARRAELAGCSRVERLPTVVDLQRYSPRSPSLSDRPLVIGWIGSPSTARYLVDVALAVELLQAHYEIRAVAVGANPEQLVGTPFQAVPWRESEEAMLVAGFDIGIMPLPDAPWERGKCGYKLIQYMACGVPVVASPVGANREIVQPEVNGLLATSIDEWEAALSRLLDNAALRHAMGGAGRRQVEEWYSLQAQAPRLIRVLSGVAG